MEQTLNIDATAAATKKASPAASAPKAAAKRPVKAKAVAKTVPAAPAQNAVKAAKAAKTAATTAKAAAPAAKSAKNAKPAAPATKKAPVKSKPAKELNGGTDGKGKQKMVRDSFTMPRADYALIPELKQRLLTQQLVAKKSELLRAGLHALATLSDAQLAKRLGALAPVKAGRPKGG